jgi:hypothetical protein
MAELGSVLTVAERNKMLAVGGDVREHAAASAMRAYEGPQKASPFPLPARALRQLE